MADKQLLFISVLLLLCQIFYGEATQECTEAEYSKYRMMLRRHIFKKITGVSLSGLCLLDCYQDVRCQSFNYVFSQHMCELNNRTKEARPEDYVLDPDRLYFRRDINRVPLGSIPELPAETCKEIKLSEGGQAVSGKYWFDSIIPGKTVQAHCDMKNEAVKKNCAEFYKSGKRNSGVYTINPDGSGTFDVFCDQTTSGGGWTVFQKRQDGTVDFYLGWADYKRGFGNLNGEFWLGLEKIHRLTSSGQYNIRVDLEDFAGNTAYAEYGSFAVASEGNKYQLSMGSYSGTAADSLTYHNGYPFTTKDQDNDSNGGNCAVSGKGAWWYNNCYSSNLNGIYRQREYNDGTSVNWYHWKRKHYSLKGAEMKIRPVNF